MTNHYQADYDGEPEVQSMEDVEYPSIEEDFAPNQNKKL